MTRLSRACLILGVLGLAGLSACARQEFLPGTTVSDTPLNRQIVETVEKYRQRLVVYVAWHPKFIHGRAIAETLYAQLNRPPAHPGGGGLGIPVLFRSDPADGGIPGTPPPASLPAPGPIAAKRGRPTPGRLRGVKEITGQCGEPGAEGEAARVGPGE